LQLQAEQRLQGKFEGVSFGGSREFGQQIEAAAGERDSIAMRKNPGRMLSGQMKLPRSPRRFAACFV
jgi:hypothetical protein